MIQIRLQDKDRLIQLAEKHFSTSIEIWVYGSRINGTSHSASDLDLVVKDDQDFHWEEFTNFEEAIRESNIPILIDLKLWSRIPDNFQQNILSNYVLLFSTLNKN